MLLQKAVLAPRSFLLNTEGGLPEGRPAAGLAHASRFMFTPPALGLGPWPPQHSLWG